MSYILAMPVRPMHTGDLPTNTGWYLARSLYQEETFAFVRVFEHQESGKLFGEITGMEEVYDLDHFTYFGEVYPGRIHGR